MAERRLLLTSSALQDLGLPDAYAGQDARSIVEALRAELITDIARANPRWEPQRVHDEAKRKLSAKYGPLLEFVSMRSQAPEGQEYTRDLPNNYKKVYNLHSGEDRGVTWWDRDRDIVWLLAAGFHRSGQRDDFYPRVVKLDSEHRLMPTAADFLTAEPDPDEEYLQELERVGRDLVAQARAQPFSEHSRVIAGRAELGMYIEVLVEATNKAEDVWIRVRTLPHHQGSDVMQDILTVVIPEADLDDVDFPPRHPARHLATGERVLRWTSA